MSAEESRRRGGNGERFTVAVLAAIVVALGYVRLHLLPSQETAEPPGFEFRNPMLDAKAGERVLFYTRDRPGNRSCARVVEGGLVLRPSRGVARIGDSRGLTRQLPYLACTLHEVRRGVSPCGGAADERVVHQIYALNYFGMPLDTRVRVDSIRPRWMRWGDREVVVFETVFERYGPLSGRWSTFLAEEAPVTGLVKWTTLQPRPSEVHFREILGAH